MQYLIKAVTQQTALMYALRISTILRRFWVHLLRTYYSWPSLHFVFMQLVPWHDSWLARACFIQLWENPVFYLRPWRILISKSQTDDEEAKLDNRMFLRFFTLATQLINLGCISAYKAIDWSLHWRSTALIQDRCEDPQTSMCSLKESSGPSQEWQQSRVQYPGPKSSIGGKVGILDRKSPVS